MQRPTDGTMRLSQPWAGSCSKPAAALLPVTKGVIVIDQVRSIDVKRLQKKLGALPEEIADKIKHNLAIILEL